MEYINKEYISREAVVRHLKGYSERERNSNSPYGMITSSVLNKAERAFSEMPAADVQPIVDYVQNEVLNYLFNKERETENMPYGNERQVRLQILREIIRYVEDL